jgi:hypothetical protein
MASSALPTPSTPRGDCLSPPSKNYSRGMHTCALVKWFLGGCWTRSANPSSSHPTELNAWHSSSSLSGVKHAFRSKHGTPPLANFVAWHWESPGVEVYFPCCKRVSGMWIGTASASPQPCVISCRILSTSPCHWPPAPRNLPKLFRMIPLRWAPTTPPGWEWGAFGYQPPQTVISLPLCGACNFPPTSRQALSLPTIPMGQSQTQTWSLLDCWHTRIFSPNR